MLTGRVPFERASDHAKLWAHLADPPPRPSAVRPELPAALDAVVARAMAKDPADRYPSAGDLGRAARAAAAGARGTAPERTVARGAAAPGGEALPPSRRRLRAHGARALARAAAAGAGPRRGDPGVRRSGRDALLGRDRRASAPRPRRAARSRRHAGRPAGGRTLRDVGFRPRGVVVAGGAVWVLSIHEPRITRLDLRPGPRGRAAVHRTRRRGHRRRPRDGLGGEAGDERGPRPRRAQRRRMRRFDTPVPPARIAAGPSGLWVVARETEGGPAVLLRYDRAGERLLEPNDVPGRDRGDRARRRARHGSRTPDAEARHARGAGRSRGTARGSRARVGAGVRRGPRLGERPGRDDSVARSTRARGRSVTTEVGGAARRARRGGRPRLRGQQHRAPRRVLDPDRMRRSVQRVRVPPNPYAMAAGARPRLGHRPGREHAHADRLPSACRRVGPWTQSPRASTGPRRPSSRRVSPPSGAEPVPRVPRR